MSDIPLIWDRLGDDEKNAWFTRLLRADAEQQADAFFATAVCFVCGSRLDETDPNHPHYQHG